MSAIRSAADWTRFAAGLYQGITNRNYFLEMTVTMERGVGIGMVQWTTVERSNGVPLDNCWSSPCDQKIIDEYTQHIQPIDPRIKASLDNFGAFLPCWRILDPKEFDKSPVVGDWTDRKDINRRWGAACVWNIDERHAGLLALLRPRTKGAFQIDELKVVKRLRSHIRRAAQLHLLFRDHPPRGRAFDDAWGSPIRPVFLLGKGRRLLTANAAGLDLLSAGDVFQTRWGELTAREPNLLAALDNALSAARQFDLEIHPRPIAVAWPRFGGMNAIKAEVMAVPGLTAELGLGERAEALIVCREVARLHPRP
jgi:hypothetical protein